MKIKKQSFAKVLLKGIGVIMMISGAVTVAASIFMIAGIYADFEYFASRLYMKAIQIRAGSGSHVFIFHLVAWIVWGYNMFLGILLFRNGFNGLRYVGRPEKSTFLLKKAISMFGLSSLGMLFGLIGQNWAGILNSLSAFIFNMLFFIGTVLNPHSRLSFKYHLHHPVRSVLSLWLPIRDHLFSKAGFLGISVLCLIEVLLCFMACMSLLPVSSGAIHSLGLAPSELAAVVLHFLAARLPCGLIGLLVIFREDYSKLNIALMICSLDIILSISSLFMNFSGLFIGIIIPLLYIIFGSRVYRLHLAGSAARL